MKKLILLAAILITLMSCDSSIEKVENPRAETTIEIQSMPADTMLVAIDEHRLYAINKESKLVEYKVSNDSDSVFILGLALGAFFALILCLIIIDW